MNSKNILEAVQTLLALTTLLTRVQEQAIKITALFKDELTEDELAQLRQERVDVLNELDALIKAEGE